MKNFILFLSCFLIVSCNDPRSYKVGLYKDKIDQGGILAIFPSPFLELAMSNCQSTIELYKADDEKLKVTSIFSGQRPLYYCREINDKKLFHSFFNWWQLFEFLND